MRSSCSEPARRTEEGADHPAGVKLRHPGLIDDPCEATERRTIVLVRRRRPVLRAAMGGGSSYTVGKSPRHGAQRERPQAGWVAELDALKAAGALTVDEFESAKRHLLAG